MSAGGLAGGIACWSRSWSPTSSSASEVVLAGTFILAPFVAAIWARRRR